MSEDKPCSKPVKAAGEPRKKKVPKKITEKHLYNAGLAYLQRFPASTAHFQRIMRRRITKSCRAHPDQDEQACIALLDKVTEQFQRSGHLNDEAYVGAIVYSLRARGLSAAMINLKLRQKGLTEDVIKEALAREDEGHENADLVAALRLARRKRLGPFAVQQTEQDRRHKWMGTLARAGFGFDTASKVLEMDADEAAETLRGPL